MGEKHPTIFRRRVLQGVGVASVPAIGFTTKSSASSPDRYSGHIYDPETFEIIGGVNADFNDQAQGFVGNINLEKYSLEINKERPKYTTNHPKETIRTYRHMEDKRKENGEKYKRLMEISDSGSGWLTGFVRGPTSLRRNGIVLVNESDRRPAEAEKFLRKLQWRR